MGRLQFAGASDIGRLRGRNEDALGFAAELGLAVVADGVGGNAAGHVASAIAVDTAIGAFRRDPGGVGPERRLSRLRRAVEAANAEILSRAMDVSEYYGMGSTIAAAAFADEVAAIASVGDSRIYRLRQGQLTQLTVDHTVVQEEIDRGWLDAAVAATSPSWGVLTRALGVAADVAVDVREESACPGDLFLLCTDGLSDALEPGEVEQMASCQENLTQLARELVFRANEKGGFDNISVLLVGIAPLAGGSR
ncbi:MAG: protein phosphatase 2C domain-containing protein [Betaproteobacteria bacterium]|nr:protein phosphatase 2C domain-containing protein [Betaproteobacteria bacterium]